MVDVGGQTDPVGAENSVSSSKDGPSNWIILFAIDEGEK